MGNENGEGNCKVVDMMECNYQGGKESQLMPGRELIFVCW